MSSYKIRSLTRKDRKILAGLIVKLAEKCNSKQLLNIISGGDESGEAVSDDERNASYIRIGIELLNSMVSFLDDDIVAWFSNLLGVDAKVFDSLPFGIEADVINQIISSGEAADFFGSVSSAYSRIRTFVQTQRNGKIE
jgi:hypothetical protein